MYINLDQISDPNFRSSSWEIPKWSYQKWIQMNQWIIKMLNVRDPLSNFSNWFIIIVTAIITVHKIQVLCELVQIRNQYININ